MTDNFSVTLVDTHCHLDQLDLTAYEGQLDKAINAAYQAGVKYFLNVCIDLQNFPAVKKIAEHYPNVYATVGLHPNEKVTAEPQAENFIELAQHPKIIGIGETGLDYYRSSGDLEWQRERFRQHIQAAKVLQKPLIVHSRDARKDTIDILKQTTAQDVGGIMHCFTEDWAMAKQALDLNFYISFSGIVTFKNAIALQEVAKQVPADRILIETDSPYLAPVPMRGKSNEPAYVRYVAEFLATLRQVGFNEFAQQTTENFKRLFKLH